MIPKAGQSKGTVQPGKRFISPLTPVNERIDQIAIHCSGQEQQGQWLKKTLEAHWAWDLPQPFIGFDEEECAFVAEWQSDTECNTLVIDAIKHHGWYHPWPDPAAGKLEGTLDLDTEEAWQLLRTALTTTRT